MACLYLDNAATSFPKPPAVLKALEQYAREAGASAGPGAYREAAQTLDRIAACHRRLGELIHAEAPKQIGFTLNCSAALERDFGIPSRSGLRFAPFAHRMIGTGDSDGACRLSFGAISSIEGVERSATALWKPALAGVAA